MNSYYKAIDQFSVNLTQLTLRYRWLVLLAALITAIGIGSGGKFLAFSNDYRDFFSSDNPELTAFEEVEATYTKNDNFFFVLEPADGKAFSKTTLTAVERLTAAAWKIPYASRVDSVTNFQYTYGLEDDLIVEDLISDAANMSAHTLSQKAALALAEPLLKNQLITDDSRVTAVNVKLQYPGETLTEVPESIAHARELRDKLEIQYPNITISLTGESALDNAFSEAGQKDSSTLVPLMFAVIILLLFAILRSFAATLATLTVIILSTVVAMGMAGFMGIKLTPISASAPIVILTLAVADSIHILISLRALMREGMARNEAIIEAVRVNFMPVTITSLTTIIGFLSLNFSDSPPFWHLGNITAIGIAAAWILSLVLLPAMVRILPIRVAANNKRSFAQKSMENLAEFVIARPRKILLGVGLVSAILISFIPQIDLNDQWTRYFDERIEFRNETDQALKYFGMYPVEFSVQAREPGGVSDPEYLNKLAQFTEFLRKQPQVTHVYSVSDIMKRLNKNLHADDPSFYRTPDERELAAQYLLLYEMSLPFGLDLNDRINIDKSATRLTATLGDTDSIETKRFLAAVEQWVAVNLPEWMAAKPTGAQVMFTYIAERNVDNMITGTLAAVIAIALILMLALRSVSLGLLSLIPNGLPILTSFGAWALLVGEVGFSVATVASISLGIIVDDTVHFMAKFVRAKNERGLNAADSVRYAFGNVGVAILVNTVVLTAGLLVLTTSSFKVNVDMGLLTILAIVFALILDFLLLPALLVLFDKKRDRKPTGENTMKKSNSPTVARPPAQTATRGTTGGVALGITGTLALTATLLALPSPQVQAADPLLTPVRGETAEEQRGFEIAARADRSDRGFADSEVKLKMVLRNAAGQESTRNLKITTLEVQDENVGDKSTVYFSSPADVKGTALLSHAQILDADDQWLYLPALKRVKRISSANKSGPFVGSEFAFEDITSLELNKYNYTWLHEEACGDYTCDVVERLPRYKNSGYTRQVTWTDQDAHQIRKVEFYDRRGGLLKTLTLKDYQNYNGVWRAQHLEMKNHQTGKSTDLVYETYTFGIGLASNDFNKSKLKQLR